MDSKRALGFVAAFMALIIGVLGFLIFALNSLGIDVGPFVGIDASESLEIWSLLAKFVLLVVASIVFIILAFIVANSVKQPIFKLFDSRWLPKENSAEVYVAGIGERLEKVAKPSFYATTLWEMISHTIFQVFFSAVLLGGIAGVVLSVLDLPGLIPAVFVSGVVTFVTIPPVFWVKEWRREYTKFVVFTFMTYYVKVRTPILSLLFGIGTLPKASRTPISQIQEIQISADPQEFDENYKTGWLQDQYTSWLAKRRNVRTLFLRSIFNRAEDILFWVDDGPGLANLLNRLIIRASQSTLVQNYLDNEAIRLKMEEGQTENYANIETSQLKESLTNRFKKTPEGFKVYDIYRVEDPGLYDSMGNPIEKQTTEEEVPSTTDVSTLFTRHRKPGQKNE